MGDVALALPAQIPGGSYLYLEVIKLNSNEYKKENNEIIQLGNVTPNNWGDQANQGRVYDTNGISPALNSMQGGGRQPHIVEVIKLGKSDTLRKLCEKQPEKCGL